MLVMQISTHVATRRVWLAPQRRKSCFSGFKTTLRQLGKLFENPNDQDDDIEMGRRKSKRKPPPKSRATEPLDTLFNCPFCNHEKSCEVKMEKTKNTGNIRCMVCMEDFQGNRQLALTSHQTFFSPSYERRLTFFQGY